jgi:hypothetical protein
MHAAEVSVQVALIILWCLVIDTKLSKASEGAAERCDSVHNEMSCFSPPADILVVLQPPFTLEVCAACV